MWKATGMQQTTNTNSNGILNKQTKKYCMLPHILGHTEHLKQNNYVKPLTANWNKGVSFSRDCKEYLIDAAGTLTVLRARRYK